MNDSNHAPIPVVLSWSGGKDSALALQALQRDNRYEVTALLTTVSEEYGRVSHHGVREELLDAQAAAIGGPRLDKIYLPSNEEGRCTNEQYEAIMREAMLGYRKEGLRHVAFGDLFLEDLRAYRESRVNEAGMEAVFPLWLNDTSALAQRFIDDGFEACLTCVDARKLDESFAGRIFDAELLDDLAEVRVDPTPADSDCGCPLPQPQSATVDPCGENGEFHTFVYNGPIFRRPVDILVAHTVHIDGRYFAELLPRALAPRW